MARRIRVIDMDGCAASSPYANPNQANFTNEEFKILHKALFDTLGKDDIFMSGSTRTSALLDLHNAANNLTHSLTHYLKRFARICNPDANDTNINKFLLGDIASKAVNLTSGATWGKIEAFLEKPKGQLERNATTLNMWDTRNTRITRQDSLINDHRQNVNIGNDEHKILLLYAIIQHAANQDPKPSANDPVEIHFYDDREDILEMLDDFYTNNPEFMPKHVSLHLHHYYDANPCPPGMTQKQYLQTKLNMTLDPQTSIVQGTGVPHPNFKEVVHQLFNDYPNNVKPKNGHKCYIPSDTLKNAKTYIDLGAGKAAVASTPNYKRSNSNNNNNQHNTNATQGNAKKQKK